MNLLNLCMAIVIASIPFQILRFFAAVTENYPAFFFALLLPFLPFSGIKAGAFFGILIFFVGTVPQMVIMPQSIKLPVNFIVVHLFWQLVKNLVVFGVIGATYRF
jgi:hypothetical protein